MLRCNECNLEFKFKVSFKKHILKEHNLSYEDYIVKHVHGGVPPTCACGCGLPTTFRNDSFFQKLVAYHYTQEMRNAVSLRRSGTSLSEETKKSISLASQTFYLSEEGKQSAASRANNLRKFHSSEEGKKWAANRSKNMIAFNSTDEGKQIRNCVAEKVSIFWKTHPEESKKMGKKISCWFSSEEGKTFLGERSEKLKKFYTSPEGRDLVKQISEKNRINCRLSREKFEERLVRITNSNIEPQQKLPTYDQYVGYRETFNIPIKIKCKKCGVVCTRFLINIINVPKCLACESLISKPQLEISNFVRSLGVECFDSDRRIISPLEIDVWIPTAQFGIEFNGLYWHSSLNRKEDYHVLNKHNLLKEKNIRLLTIFEDEWRDKRSIVESMIQNRLGRNSVKIGARECAIIEVDNNIRKEFFNANHIDGDVRAKVAYGLQFHNELVACISLRRPFHNSLGDKIEIARFATKKNMTVVGGLSRLLSHVRIMVKQPIMTYVDKRLGNGESYQKAGFKLIRETGPRFWWTDFVNRYDRFKIKSCDGKTQNEIGLSMGLHKIWGASNLVFEA